MTCSTEKTVGERHSWLWQYSHRFRARRRTARLTLAGRRIREFPWLDSQLPHQRFEGHLAHVGQFHKKRHSLDVGRFYLVG